MLKNRRITFIVVGVSLLLTLCAAVFWIYRDTLIAKGEEPTTSVAENAVIDRLHTWVETTSAKIISRCYNHQYENGVCRVCGHVCTHSFTSGVCNLCGTECDHLWEDGICFICGMACEHRWHDIYTQRCTECGELVRHHMVNAQCSVCGYQPQFLDDFLPDEYYTACDEQGTVLTHHFSVPLYGTDKVISRVAKIYLPYGYDENDTSVKYNVLIATHGAGDDGDALIDKVQRYGGAGRKMIYRDMYDWMHKYKECDPFIVVGVSYEGYIGDNFASVSGAQFGRELREYLLPYMAENFHTYAENGSEEALQKARQHFGMCGFSNGSLMTLQAGIIQDFDIMGNFICMSGNHCYVTIADVLNSEKYQNYPIHCYYASAGTNDNQLSNTSKGCNWLIENVSRAHFGSNTFLEKVDGGHDYKVWHTSMYNALKVMFQDVSESVPNNAVIN